MLFVTIRSSSSSEVPKVLQVVEEIKRIKRKEGMSCFAHSDLHAHSNTHDQIPETRNFTNMFYTIRIKLHQNRRTHSIQRAETREKIKSVTGLHKYPIASLSISAKSPCRNLNLVYDPELTLTRDLLRQSPLSKHHVLLGESTRLQHLHLRLQNLPTVIGKIGTRTGIETKTNRRTGIGATRRPSRTRSRSQRRRRIDRLHQMLMGMVLPPQEARRFERVSHHLRPHPLSRSPLQVAAARQWDLPSLFRHSHHLHTHAGMRPNNTDSLPYQGTRDKLGARGFGHIQGDKAGH